MAVTLREIRHTVSRKLGGFNTGLVSIAPDASDNLAQRSILSSKLFDAEKGSKGFAGHFAWIGKYKDERRVRENGYRSLPYVVYTPPTSGTYTITAYGYGTSSSLAYNASTEDIATALQAIGQGLGSLSVSGGSGDPIVIALPDIIDVEISAGEVLSTGGIGAVEVNRAFTKALQIGDEWEIHAKLPVEDGDEVQGLNWCINFAARKLTTIDKFPITPVRNSLGTKTFLGLSGESWLFDKKQIIGVYQPTEWEVIATFTPPDSSTYTLSVDIGSDLFTTSALAYDATNSEISDALSAAVTGITLSVSGTTTKAITLSKTWYAQATITASSGTVTQVTNMLRSPALYPNTWNFSYDAESPYLDNLSGSEGRSFLVEAYRQAHTWVCPQASYGVKGSVWQSSEVGLVDDFDQIDVLLDDIAAVAFAYACDQLSMVGPGSDRGYWADEAKRAHRVAAGIKTFDMPLQEKPAGNQMVNAYTAQGFFR